MTDGFFGSLFDFNGDGELDGFERISDTMLLLNLMSDDEDDYDDEEEEDCDP